MSYPVRVGFEAGPVDGVALHAGLSDSVVVRNGDVDLGRVDVAQLMDDQRRIVGHNTAALGPEPSEDEFVVDVDWKVSAPGRHRAPPRSAHFEQPSFGVRLPERRTVR